MPKLKSNLSNIPNINNFLEDTNLNDYDFSDDFFNALKKLITGWLSSSDRNIKLSKSFSNPKNAVLFTTNAIDSKNPSVLGRDLRNDLQQYVTNSIKTDNGTLSVNTQNSEITFTPRTTNTTQKNNTTGTTTDDNTNSDSGGKINTSGSISSIAQQLVQGGVFNNPMTKDVAIKEHNNLLEEIERLKKLMKL
jgi:hypothetical protein